MTNSKALAPAVSDCPHRGCLQFHSLFCPGRSCVDDFTCHPTTRNTINSCFGCRQLLCGFRSVDCPLRHLLAVAKTIRIGLTAGVAQLSCSASGHTTLVTHLYTDQEPAPEFLQQSPRPTVKLQVLSWNPRFGRGSDQRALADHVNGHWHINCSDGGRLRHRSVSGGELLRDHRAPFRRAPQGYLCARLHVHADPGSLLAHIFVVGMAVTGKKEYLRRLQNAGKCTDIWWKLERQPPGRRPAGETMG